MSTAPVPEAGQLAVTSQEANSGVVAQSIATRMVPLIQRSLSHVVELADRVLESDLTSEQRGQLTMAQSTATSVLELAGDIADLAQLQAGGLELDALPFDLPQLARDTVGASVATARAIRKQLDLSIDPDLPQFAIGDPGRLRQLLSNVINFVLEDAPRGPVELQVSHREKTDDTWRLRVEITFPGVPLTHERFQDVLELGALDRGVLTTQLTADLGLAIAARLAQLMGGALEAQSPPEGSRFCVEVDITRDTDPAVPAMMDDPPEEELKVMVITDEYGRAAQLQPMLDAAAVRRVTTCGVQEGIDLLALTSGSADSPDALLLYSLKEPEDAAALLHDSGCLEKVPAVLVVPRGQRGDAVKFKGLGIAGYLTEPVVPIGLGEALRAAVAIRHRGGSELVTAHYLREKRRKLRVLIADDSALSRKLAVELLERRGHTAIAVTNGREAVDAWLSHPFDVIVLDLEMPILGGLDACAEILSLASPGELPTILGMTTQATEEHDRMTQAVGMVGCLTKPFRLEDLILAVERAEPQPHDSDRVDGSPEPQTRHGVIDVRQAVDQLGSLALFSECVLLLRDELPELIAAVDDAYGKRNFKEAAAVAHRLRGSLASVYATEASLASRGVELAARAEDETRLRKEVLRLKSALARLEPELEAFAVD